MKNFVKYLMVVGIILCLVSPSYAVNTWYIDPAVADNTGAGTSWATAWRSMTGATAAKGVAAGDTVKIAESTAPYTIGKATWNQYTKVVTLGTYVIPNTPRANPTVFTYVGHGFVTGDVVLFGTVAQAGWTALQNTYHTVTVSGNTFSIAVDSTGYAADYTAAAETFRHAPTLTVDRCESAWTANGSGDMVGAVSALAVATDGKEGSYCFKGIFDAAIQNSTMQAYFAWGTGTLDLSRYQKLTFWIKPEVAVGNATTLTITLCSDNAGASPVDTFTIPALPKAGNWVPLTLARDSGGNLGNSIQSIAINTGSSVSFTAAKYIMLDNFEVCTTNGLNMESLISKNSLQQGGTEAWYAPQSIVGTTILIDNHTNNKAGAGRGYDGATEEVATYARETFKTTMGSDTNAHVPPVGGVATTIPATWVYFEGGYNKSTGDQTGETFFSGSNCADTGLFGAVDFQSFNHLHFVRYNYGVNSVYPNWKFANCSVSHFANAGVYCNQSMGNQDLSFWYLNNGGNSGFQSTLGYSGRSKITIYNANNNIGDGCYFTGIQQCYIDYVKTDNNSLYGLSFAMSGNVRIGTFHATNNSNTVELGKAVVVSINDSYTTPALSPTTGFSSSADYYPGWVAIDKIAGDATAGVTIYKSGYVAKENSVRHTASGLAWKLAPTAVTRSVFNPLYVKVADVACNTSKLVTVKAWLRRSHANLTVSLVCRGGQVGGPVADTKVDLDDSGPGVGNYVETTLTFTPTENTVLEVECWAYYNTAGTYTYVGYIDDLTITQAD